MKLHIILSHWISAFSYLCLSFSLSVDNWWFSLSKSLHLSLWVLSWFCFFFFFGFWCVFVDGFWWFSVLIYLFLFGGVFVDDWEAANFLTFSLICMIVWYTWLVGIWKVFPFLARQWGDRDFGWVFMGKSGFKIKKNWAMIMMGLCVWCSLRLLEAYRKRELALVNLTSYPFLKFSSNQIYFEASTGK